jgi:hypothetical protein
MCLIDSENELNIYLNLRDMVQFPRKTKTPLRESGEDREVALAVQGSPKVVGPELLHEATQIFFRSLMILFLLCYFG